MSDEPTTDRAQRLQAVASGQRDTAIDRVETADPSTGVGRGSARTRQRQSASALAESIGVPRDAIARREQIGGDVDLSLRSGGVDSFRESVREDFASEASFVEPSDVTANVNRREISAAPVVAQDRRDDVGERAESEAASDAEFVTASDLEADVGARGVVGLGIPESRREDVEQRAVSQTAGDSDYLTAADLDADVTDRGVTDILIPESRRDDVAQRAEQALASGAEFVRPSDVDADVSDSGVTDVGVIESRQDDIAARVREDLAGDSEFLNPADINVSVTESGVSEAGVSEAGRDRAQRRQRQQARQSAASQLDSEYPGVDIGTGDLTKSDGEFRLDQGTQRSIAANDLDSEFPAIDIGTNDVTSQDGGFGLTTSAQKRLAADQLESETALDSVGVDDVTSDVGGFALDERARRRLAADQLEGDTPLDTIDPQRDLRSGRETDSRIGEDGTEQRRTRRTDELRLSDDAQRVIAAEQFEAQTALPSVGADDVIDTGTGFQLDESARKLNAATNIVQQTALEQVDDSEISLGADGGVSLGTSAQARLAARNIEASNDAIDELDASEDITLDRAQQRVERRTRREDGQAASRIGVERGGLQASLTRDAQLQVGANVIDAQLPSVDVGVDDVELENGEVVFGNGGSS